ncbi:MAG: hypothetical protein H6926_09505 [Chromatiales bacterium]|nr:hypothetical protein [Chromatiales bacterium]
MTDIEYYEPQQGQLVAEPDVDSWVHILAPVGDLAAKIAGTDFVPKDFRGKPAAVAGAILFGRELGLPPMTTLKNTYVVHGTPDLSAEAQRALVLAAGHEIEFEEVTATRCKMRGRRVGSEVWTQAQYTMDEAKQSGDFSKNANYKSRPQEMLIARCTSRLCSMIFPDVTGGFSSAVNVPLVQSEDDTAPPAEQPKVTVQQEPKKAPARRKPKAEPKPEAKQPEPAQESSEPPLPGEDGYEEFDSEPALPTPPAQPQATPTDDGAKPTRKMLTALHAALNAAGLTDRADKLQFCSDVVGREVSSSTDLTRAEVGDCLDTLSGAPAEPEVVDGELVD